MSAAPDYVIKVLERVKKGYSPPDYIVLRRINSHYYIYRDRRPWDPEKKRIKTVSEYLGRITENGAFIRKVASKDDELENAKEIIASRGGTVIIPERKENTEEPSSKLLSPKETDRKILTILSMNGRATIPFIAERVGLSVSAVNSRIKRLERQYGIRYIAEIDVTKLGYIQFLMMAKFLEKVPTAEEVKGVIEKDPRIQYAAFLSGGKYQLLMYVLDDSAETLTHLLRSVIFNTLIAEYPAEWTIAVFYETYNFMPLRDAFVKMLESKSGIKEPLFGGEPSQRKMELLRRETTVLKELNNYGKAEFTEIDKKYGFDKGRAHYSYYKLLERGLLKRITITMERLPIKYMAAISTTVVIPGLLSRTRNTFLHEIISETSTPPNKYALVGDVHTPFGAFLLMPVFRDTDIGVAEKKIKEASGILVYHAVITETLLGSPCFRRFDNAYTSQSATLSREFGEPAPEKREYMKHS